jgi:imidazoleglycerol-phosphate dehydratase
MRQSSVQRKTTETHITLRLCLDGSGRTQVSTGIPFFDHMLCQLARHGWFDLEVQARGDLQVDLHHTVEDVGICLGKALREALASAEGVRRFASIQIPMDECLVAVSLDLSGRPYLLYRGPRIGQVPGGFSISLMEGFMRALSLQAGITLHVHVLEEGDPHHLMEATFKALGRALGEAISLDPRTKGVPSTKGIVD